MEYETKAYTQTSDRLCASHTVCTAIETLSLEENEAVVAGTSARGLKMFPYIMGHREGPNPGPAALASLCRSQLRPSQLSALASTCTNRVQ